MKELQENDQLGNNDQSETNYQKKIRLLKIRFLNNYKNSACNITEACNKTGITRRTYYNWIESDPDFKIDVDHTEDESLDFAEAQLRTLMKGQFKWRMKKDATGKDTRTFERDANGEKIKDWITEIDNASVIFFLKTKGKKRGYVYRQEIAGVESSTGGGFEIVINRKKKASE